MPPKKSETTDDLESRNELLNVVPPPPVDAGAAITCDVCGRLITYFLFRSVVKNIDVCNVCRVHAEQHDGKVSGVFFNSKGARGTKEFDFSGDDALFFMGHVPPIPKKLLKVEAHGEEQPHEKNPWSKAAQEGRLSCGTITQLPSRPSGRVDGASSRGAASPRGRKSGQQANDPVKDKQTPARKAVENASSSVKKEQRNSVKYEQTASMSRPENIQYFVDVQCGGNAMTENFSPKQVDNDLINFANFDGSAPTFAAERSPAARIVMSGQKRKRRASASVKVEEEETPVPESQKADKKPAAKKSPKTPLTKTAAPRKSAKNVNQKPKMEEGVSGLQPVAPKASPKKSKAAPKPAKKKSAAATNVDGEPDKKCTNTPRANTAPKAKNSSAPPSAFQPTSESKPAVLPASRTESSMSDVDRLPSKSARSESTQTATEVVPSVTTVVVPAQAGGGDEREAPTSTDDTNSRPEPVVPVVTEVSAAELRCSPQAEVPETAEVVAPPIVPAVLTQGRDTADIFTPSSGDDDELDSETSTSPSDGDGDGTPAVKLEDDEEFSPPPDIGNRPEYEGESDLFQFFARYAKPTLECKYDYVAPHVPDLHVTYTPNSHDRDATVYTGTINDRTVWNGTAAGASRTSCQTEVLVAETEKVVSVNIVPTDESLIGTWIVVATRDGLASHLHFYARQPGCSNMQYMFRVNLGNYISIDLTWVPFPRLNILSYEGVPFLGWLTILRSTAIIHATPAATSYGPLGNILGLAGHTQLVSEYEQSVEPVHIQWLMNDNPDHLAVCVFYKGGSLLILRHDPWAHRQRRSSILELHKLHLLDPTEAQIIPSILPHSPVAYTVVPETRIAVASGRHITLINSAFQAVRSLPFKHHVTAMAWNSTMLLVGLADRTLHRVKWSGSVSQVSSSLGAVVTHLHPLGGNLFVVGTHAGQLMIAGFGRTAGTEFQPVAALSRPVMEGDTGELRRLSIETNFEIESEHTAVLTNPPPRFKGIQSAGWLLDPHISKQVVWYQDGVVVPAACIV